MDNSTTSEVAEVGHNSETSVYVMSETLRDKVSGYVTKKGSAERSTVNTAKDMRKDGYKSWMLYAPKFETDDDENKTYVTMEEDVSQAEHQARYNEEKEAVVAGLSQNEQKLRLKDGRSLSEEQKFAKNAISKKVGSLVKDLRNKIKRLEDAEEAENGGTPSRVKSLSRTILENCDGILKKTHNEAACEDFHGEITEVQKLCKQLKKQANTSPAKS